MIVTESMQKDFAAGLVEATWTPEVWRIVTALPDMPGFDGGNMDSYDWEEKLTKVRHVWPHEFIERVRVWKEQKDMLGEPTRFARIFIKPYPQAAIHEDCNRVIGRLGF